MAQFSQYEKLFKDVEKKYRDGNKEMPRVLRLFDIKFRLVLGITDVVFDSNIAKVKSAEVKECYVQLIKTTELWNVFEALFEYANLEYKLGTKDKIEKMLSKMDLKDPEILNVLRNGFLELKDLYSKNKQFPTHFKEYYNRIFSNINIGEKNRKALDRIKTSLETGKTDQDSAMLYLMYIDRNLFYHTAEAVKMGMSYSNRLAYMKMLFNTLRNYNLTVIIVLLKKELQAFG